MSPLTMLWILGWMFLAALAVGGWVGTVIIAMVTGAHNGRIEPLSFLCYLLFALFFTALAWWTCPFNVDLSLR